MVARCARSNSAAQSNTTSSISSAKCQFGVISLTAVLTAMLVRNRYFHTFALFCTLVQVQVRSQWCEARTVRPLHFNYTSLRFSSGEMSQESISVPLQPHPSASRAEVSNRLERSDTRSCNLRSSVEDCHNPDENYEYQCIWCEYWCLTKRDPIQPSTRACKEVPEELAIATFPKFDKIWPPVIIESVPTLVTVYGENLDIKASYVNNTAQITYGSYECKVIVANSSFIQCILDGVDFVKPDEDFVNVTVERVLYGSTVLSNWSNGSSVTLLRLDAVIPFQPTPAPEPEPNRWLESNVEIFVGLTIGLSCITLVGVLFIKRHQARHLYETVEQMIMLRKMKKMLVTKELYVEYDKVQLKTKLGDGNFGEVYLAQVTQADNSFEVAIKKLKKGSDLTKTRMFLTEGIRMSEFRHNRILSPVSIMIDKTDQSPAIVLPIMVNGDLCHYLRKNKVFPIVKLLRFALQIAEGMEYLSSIQVVHGDLASRNCLLDEKLEIKIGDFGLSRQMYRTDYVTINDIYRPIRWMALECLTSKKPRFTTKSDVWSFGVVLWEIFTLGSYPYEEFDNWDLHRHLQDGYRLHRPLNCPLVVHALMAECWAAEAAQRPTFSELKVRLSATLAAIEQEQSTNKQTELAHSSLRDHFNYTTLAECYVQNRSNSDGSVALSLASSTISAL